MSKPVPYRSSESKAKSVYIITRLAQGATVQQIAEELGVTVSTVHQRVRRETDWWLQNMGNVVAQIKVTQTQQLQYIYSQAMLAWMLSAEVDESGKPTKAGDAKYLDSAMRSLSEVRKIWNADDKIEVTDEGNAIISREKAGLTVNQVNEVLQVLESIDALPAGIDLDKIQSEIIPSEIDYTDDDEEE